jgi:hypothetical protein
MEACPEEEAIPVDEFVCKVLHEHARTDAVRHPAMGQVEIALREDLALRGSARLRRG